MSKAEVLTQTALPDLKLHSRGKVRDIYDLGDVLLIVTTDRISAFDVVLPQGIPQKGRVLTQISAFWFEKMKDVVENHLVATEVSDFPRSCRPYHDVLRGRSMLVKKASPLPVECIVRGYLSGSGWKEYQNTGHVCGIELPSGLVESDRLPEPIFTPSTKAEVGRHDENITFEQAVELTGAETARRLQELSIEIYNRARSIAEPTGIIIADTKMEFGMFEDKLILIDELLTPDSSRFWPADDYRAGRSQDSFDKQFVRDYLQKIDWNKEPPAPDLPDEIIENTSKKYVEALERLTGQRLN